jgi:hypothetical protein
MHYKAFEWADPVVALPPSLPRYRPSPSLFLSTYSESEWVSTVAAFEASADAGDRDPFTSFATYLGSAPSLPFAFLYATRVPSILQEWIAPFTQFDTLEDLRCDIRRSCGRYQPSPVLKACLKCCRHLCHSPLCVESGFGSPQIAEALLHISHFVHDPCAPIALEIVASLFDHSVELIEQFEGIEFSRNL